MRREDKAMEMVNAARAIEDDDPRQAIEKLKLVAQEYPDTWAARNPAINDIISIAEANEWWGEAAQAAERGAKQKPLYTEDYDLSARAYRLREEGREYEALEVPLERRKAQGASSPGIYRHFANEFAKIGAHDRAWRLYNQAIGKAGEERVPTHRIRRDMADLPLKEDKPNHAVETMITAFHEAKLLMDKDPPKVVEKHLRKALRAAGINLRLQAYRDLPDRLIETCESQGREAAVELFYAWKKAEGEPEGWKAQIVEEPREQVPQDQEPSLLKRLLGWTRERED